MTLQESFTIIVQACNEARLNKQERVDVEKALQAVVVELYAFEELKKTEVEPSRTMEPCKRGEE